MVYLSEAYLPIRAVIYSPASKTNILIQGVSTYLKRHDYTATGTSQWSEKDIYSAVGYKSLIPAHGRWLVKAVKRVKKSYVIPVEAVAYKTEQLGYALKGVPVTAYRGNFALQGLVEIGVKCLYFVKLDYAGEVKRFLIARGRICLDSKAFYPVRSIIAMGSRAVALVKAKLGQTQSYVYGAEGHLSSNVVNFLLALKGYVPKIAFIASVPKKYQDFVSSKRWFR